MKVAVVAGLVALVVMTGCGGGEVLVHSQTARPIGETAASQCPIEYKTLATATDAYWAMEGFSPSSEGELVSAGLLLREVGGFDLLLGDEAYELIAVDDCEGFVPT
jgi:hypothetical protein